MVNRGTKSEFGRLGFRSALNSFGKMSAVKRSMRLGLAASHTCRSRPRQQRLGGTGRTRGSSGTKVWREGMMSRRARAHQWSAPSGTGVPSVDAYKAIRRPPKVEPGKSAGSPSCRSRMIAAVRRDSKGCLHDVGERGVGEGARGVCGRRPVVNGDGLLSRYARGYETASFDTLPLRCRNGTQETANATPHARVSKRRRNPIPDHRGLHRCGYCSCSSGTRDQLPARPGDR
jgi:hypothetical protein